MPGPVVPAASTTVPTGALFDIVLLLHVAAVIFALGTVVTSGVQAARVLAAGSAAPPRSVVAYFRPGVNWAGRVLYAVPVFGFALLGLSSGAYTLGQDWVVWGLVLWVVAALVAEWVLWPAERRVQAAIGDGDSAETLGRACRATCGSAAVLAVVLVVAVVLMVARP